jgi:hypothetical protein
VMVTAFREQLNRRLAAVTMPPGVRTELQSNAGRLAGLKAPSDVGQQTAAGIEDSIVSSFVFSFRLVMWICAALALASAAVALRVIPEPSAIANDQDRRRSRAPSIRSTSSRITRIAC